MTTTTTVISSSLLSSSSSSSSSPLLLTSGASGRVNALISLRTLKNLLLFIKAFLFFILFFPFQLGRCSNNTSSSTTNTKRSSSSSSSSSCSSEKKSSCNKEQQTKSNSSGGGGGAMVIVPLPQPKKVADAVVVSGNLDVATRRAIAIKRATIDDDNDENSSIREVSLFRTARGDTLFTQSWTPPISIKIRGVVVLLHGLNEHSGRYNDFAKKLNANGFKVYGMDWIGHGGSDGLHGYVHSLDYAVNDMKAFIEKIAMENGGLPCFCFGHSTGGAIILKSILDPKIQALVKGVVLTSPAVRVQPSHPIFGVLAPVVSFLLPTYQFTAANKNGTIVSRDPEALIAKYSDPLVYTGSIRVRTGYEILCISAYLQQNLSRLTTPFLVLHGTADAVTDPDASVKLHEKASSTDKSIKLYKGLLHDLLFEPEREVVAKDIIEWLDSRV
ncbi:hypothetical protein AQUCO_09400031v1 [Aquilegia coerulea]|uniref:Serine aminopeptidase S33 domain-containing protein n=1 Tax=Aquilegia coerulea TaxID=218851 RepID=A0A2G5C548_AQUCA|nr:hypothetical protein AQUCO_09400031v1 [Aquilegia coerulea]